MKEKIKVLSDMGLSQTTIAKGVGVDRSSVGKWARGEREATEENEKRLDGYIASLIKTLEAIR